MYSVSDLEMPDHDLQPPRFCRVALEQLLDDWSAVKAMIMSGVTGSVEDQSGTALLDKFTYKMLVKCGAEVIHENEILFGNAEYDAQFKGGKWKSMVA
jgi:E3 ubiquitin-protein ligase EDD1